jgi:hypothetical protein
MIKKTMSEYSTSNGDDYEVHTSLFSGVVKSDPLLSFRTDQLISSIIRSLDDKNLERRLCWRDDKAWKALEASYEAIKRGE